jgi:hypothetical protein
MDFYTHKDKIIKTVYWCKRFAPYSMYARFLTLKSTIGIYKIYRKIADVTKAITTAVITAPDDACRPTAALVLVVAALGISGGHCGATSCSPYVEATQRSTPFVHPNPA